MESVALKCGILLILCYCLGSTSATSCMFTLSYFPYYSVKDCTYGCCTDVCCSSSVSSIFSTYTQTAGTALAGWVIGVIVGCSILGLIIVISIIVCIVMACKGSSGSRIRPINQPGVTVISAGVPGPMTTTTGYSTQPLYGPAHGQTVQSATYGPPQPVAPGPRPYTYANPTYGSAPRADPSHPSPAPYQDPSGFGQKP